MSELIEGLPDAVALRCLAMVPFYLYPKLELVSRPWQAAIRSSDLFTTRKELGLSEDLLCVCAYQPENTWQLYDPLGDHWMTLPLLPSKIGHLANFSVVSTAQKLFVLGGGSDAVDPVTGERYGCFATDEVWVYDPVARQWATCAPMLVPRSMFACCVLEGKIIVAGGFTSSRRPTSQAEIYNPEENTWAPIPDLSHAHDSPCYGVVYKGKMHVLHRSLSTMQVLISDKSGFKWVIENDCWLQGPAAILNDEFYMMCHEHIFKQEAAKWKQIVSVSEFRGRIGFAMIGAKGKIYIIGGVAGPGSQVQGFQPLSDVDVLTVDNNPPAWHKASPMTKCHGTIIGCALLKL
uniref:F-box domain-containing protein n=1 Tax=Kalanchoe fedtschenkoi TaxID=63787 RepID=A0A7N0T3V9_KALFE